MIIEFTKENLARMSERVVASRDYTITNEKNLREKYNGKAIAFLNGTIIDSDEDIFKLWTRLAKKPCENGDVNNYSVISTIDALISKLEFSPFEEGILGIRGI